LQVTGEVTSLRYTLPVATITTKTQGIGALIRDWRQRRRMSQLDLAVEADVSTRHLSFIETGRSRPSRELVLDLAEQLDVPLRERNTLLLAAGYAPGYQETALDAGEMAPVRAAIDKILTGHEPFPAIVVDRLWNVSQANRPALAILTDGVSQDPLSPPVNALRVSLHPEGLARRIVNFPEYSEHIVHRLHRQAVLSGDPELFALEDELSGYPGVSQRTSALGETADLIFMPLVLQVTEEVRFSFFSTLATFGTAIDITVSELAIESFFPADEATAVALRTAWAKS
jgi:transcriptional regulator with XRE-family HTH domain